MERYFKLLEQWNTPDNVIEFLRSFTFFYDAMKSIKKLNRPIFLDQEMMVENRIGTCGHVAYFFVKTLNFMNPAYAAFAVTYTWGVRTDKDKLHKVAKLVGTYRVPMWHEYEKIYFLYFDDLDYSTLKRVGPFKSYENLNSELMFLAQNSLKNVDKDVPISTGVHILDVRVANDPRIRRALDYFGVDNFESWYGKHQIKEIPKA